MRALLIVPPFGSLDRPSLGLHTLQACARARGHTVDIFYSNILFGALLGEIPYMVIANTGARDLLGERVMGLPQGSELPSHMLDQLNERIDAVAESRGIPATAVTLEAAHRALACWLEEVEKYLAARSYDIIGFSTTFEQTNAVRLLARKCRDLKPAAKLVVGGANCDGPMATAIRRLIPEIDVVFSGESEIAFADYLDDCSVFAGRDIIASQPNQKLDALPLVDYAEYFWQLDEWLPESVLRRDGDIRLSYETSRGCWWGQKNHCTFCGLNGSGMGYREKTPEKVVTELADIVAATGLRKVDMTDNIMPFSFFDSLIPRLAEADLDLELFYEQKANISFDKMLALRAAGVVRIQPGIEALHDDLLRLMKKGTSTKQNIALLRYARSIGIVTDWNILSGFPGDSDDWYGEMADLAPLIVHLQPPSGVYSLSIDRFSPYFERPEHYGIRNIEPVPSYAEAFPGCNYLHDLAYHFRGESSGATCESSANLRRLRDCVSRWGEQWHSTNRPGLDVIELSEGQFLLFDSRGLPGSSFMQEITAEQASVALSFHTEPSAVTRWGEENAVCVRGRNGFIPLACAAPKLLHHFESIRAPDLADAPV